MSVYARSDVAAVAVPVEDGGCGAVHSRPVIDGAPAKTWRLTCPACERYIREDIARSTWTTIEDGGKKVLHNNGIWGESALKIPLTPDEAEVATEMEKSGKTIMHQVAEGMSRQALEQMHRNQADEIEQTEAKAAAVAATDRVAQLEAQLAEMQNLIRGLADRAPRGVRVTETAKSVDSVPSSSELAKAVSKAHDESLRAVASTTTCESCGGPLRRSGSRGATPKRICLDCRAVA